MTGLPAHLLPTSFQRVVAFFELVDQCYGFLLKRKLQPNVKNLAIMYNQLSGMTELRGFPEWESFHRANLEGVVAICGNEFKLVQIDVNESSTELAFKTFPGPGKGHSASRRKCLMEALTQRVVDHIKQLMNQPDTDVKKLLSAAKKNGWPAECGVEQCPPPFLPFQPSLAPLEESVFALDESDTPPPPDEAPRKYPGGFSGSYRSVLEGMEQLKIYKDQVRHVEYFPPKAASYASLDRPLPVALHHRLCEHLSVDSLALYQHQALAINAVRAGKHVIVSTSTASGKSLIYNLPVIEAMMEAPARASALYLFPTKALAQDQLRNLHALVGPATTLCTVPVVCDGDTPMSDRTHIQQAVGNVLLTNPDMLHYTLLPDHKAWKRVFSSLKVVVVDEAHHYRGAFGAHVAAVLRRLVRVCWLYGCSPQFVCCTATIANPLEHMCRLLPMFALAGLSRTQRPPLSEGALQFAQNRLNILLVDGSMDGAPRGERTVVIWNPPLRQSSDSSSAASAKVPSDAPSNDFEEVQLLSDALPSTAPALAPVAPSSSTQRTGPKLYPERASSIIETAQLLAFFVVQQQRTIAFCRVRKLVELVYKYTQTALSAQGHEALLPLLSSYRGGYSKEERRLIEHDLFTNRLLGVAATSALELGINIGQLNVTMHMGFPGSFASLWQQMGRAGRSVQPSLHVIVCFNCPIDQFFAKCPNKLVHSSAESVAVDCENVYILRTHLVDAAYEVPLNYSFDVPGIRARDVDLWGGEYASVIEHLTSQQTLHAFKGTARFTAARSVEKVSLRMIDPLTITVLSSAGSVLDSIGYSRAFYELYEGAIYMHRGDQFLVHRFDLPARTAHVRPVVVKYHTSAQNRTDVNVVKVLEEDRSAHLGIVQVLHSIYGFEKRHLYSNQVIETGECVLPPLEYETQSCWIEVPLEAKREVEQGHGFDAFDAVHAANHCLVNSLMMRVSCDGADVACEHGSPHNRLLVFDKHMGGTGVCVEMFKQRDAMLAMALELLRSCPCTDGCPACVYDTRCTQYNNHLHKMGAMVLLQKLIDLRNRTAACQPCVGNVATAGSEGSPRKEARKRTWERAAFRESGRARALAVQSAWTEDQPNFVTETHMQL